MKTMAEELREIPAKKKIITSVEYDCGRKDAADEVFATVTGIVTDHLDELAKITFDRNEADHTCRVELTQNA
ncbi:hypothetical protein [uncultured Faecalibaculum sp.]|uniref:hypothetical protein n=1 Tax=uncultured Faecalibaculum sp. TaxID=1729681 RepID=UPI0025D53AA3|nr:hypothetical protein [uncultured Faecalibaculum sp.]